MNDNTTKTPQKKTKAQLIHQYYSYTGFYSFVGNSLKKAIPPILIAIIALVLLDIYVIDFKQSLIHITKTYSDWAIFSIFFASESLLGLIPPEIFIAWSDKASSPILYLTALAWVSYAGGIVSYTIGKLISHIPSVEKQVQTKLKSHIKNTRKWGGFLIIVGALLPIPFSMTSIAAGFIDYKFSNYLLFGLLRILRFYIYAVPIFFIL